MPEARDRLTQSEDAIAVYSRRRLSMWSRRGEVGRSGGGIEILADEPQEAASERTPFRWGDTPMTGTNDAAGVLAGSGGVRTGGLVTPRNVLGRNLYRSPATRIGRQNVFAGRVRGRGQGRRSVLPSWYPRTPLRDVTAVVRAIERRRARLGEGQGLNSSSGLPQDRTVLDPSVSTSGAQLEHDVSMISPSPTIGVKPYLLSIAKGPKILLDTTNQDNEESGFLTPQKKLLNSIDKVEKVVMAELRKLERTPTAKKAEREKRVHTLMSMR